MVTLNETRVAEFETTSRLLACLVNEGLVHASVVHDPSSAVSVWLELRSWEESPGDRGTIRIRAAASPASRLIRTEESLQTTVRPIDLAPPVVIAHRHDDTTTGELPGMVELNLAGVFDIVTPWLMDQGLDRDKQNQIKAELENSAQNQGLYVSIQSRTVVS